MRFFLFTDGASRGNPGPAAAGVVLKDERGKVLAEVSQPLGRMTNNEAEYRALILGLTKARELVRDGTLVVLMDSELVISQLTGLYKIKAVHLRSLAAEVKAKEKAFSKLMYTHIPREKNARADELANAAF